MDTSSNQPSRNTPKILLLEDNAATRAALVRLFRTFGYDVRTASCIKVAREYARRELFDLAICDLGLPDGVGSDFFTELQTIHPTPGIVISGYGTVEDIRRSLDAGLSAHYTKPASIEVVRTAIEKLFPGPTTPPSKMLPNGVLDNQLLSSGGGMQATASTKMKILALFSNPPDTTPLRLDKEDKELSSLARQFRDTVELERQHASDVNDVHGLVTRGGFDVVHFSGHGSSEGIYLDRMDQQSGELVSAQRVVSLLDLADKPPLLAVFLCCYSDDAIQDLACIAPFVVTSRCEVTDEECILFVRGLYETFFAGSSVQSAFEHARALLRAKGMRHEIFNLSRRTMIKSRDSVLVECKPHVYKDSILINLDAVTGRLSQLNMSEAELAHLFARKLRIHQRIFDRPRERALIPVGRLLFGEFTWTNSKDVVYCNRLLKLRSDVDPRHWTLWATLLTSYNDLASHEYRSLPEPADPSKRATITRAVELFRFHLTRFLAPQEAVISALGFSGTTPNIAFVKTHCDQAEAQLAHDRYAETVESLELALTNYHEVVDALQPPEET